MLVCLKLGPDSARLTMGPWPISQGLLLVLCKKKISWLAVLYICMCACIQGDGPALTITQIKKKKKNPLPPQYTHLCNAATSFPSDRREKQTEIKDRTKERKRGGVPKLERRTKIAAEDEKPSEGVSNRREQLHYHAEAGPLTPVLGATRPVPTPPRPPGSVFRPRRPPVGCSGGGGAH